MQYTERDRKMLVDLTRHGVETAEQLRRKFFRKEGGGHASLTAVYGRMKKLEGARLVKHDRVLWGRPGVYRTTEAGARVAGVGLGSAPLDWTKLEHQIAVVDLADELLEEHPGATWTTERELRRDELDGPRDEEGRLLKMGERRRISDGLMVLADGSRVAVELELSAKKEAAYRALLDKLSLQFLNEELEGVWFYFKSSAALERMRRLAEGDPGYDEGYWFADRLRFEGWSGSWGR